MTDPPISQMSCEQCSDLKYEYMPSLDIGESLLPTNVYLSNKVLYTNRMDSKVLHTRVLNKTILCITVLEFLRKVAKS